MILTEPSWLVKLAQEISTPVDVIVVDEWHRLPIGRPYLTVAPTTAEAKDVVEERDSAVTLDDARSAADGPVDRVSVAGYSNLKFTPPGTYTTRLSSHPM